MKIGIHANQFCNRGTGKVPLDYANALKKYYNHNIVMITSNEGDNRGMFKIKPHFPIIQYKGSANNIDQRLQVKDELTKIVDQEKIDFLYLVKWGIDDLINPTNCKTGTHCVFEMTQPHGSVYAGVSEYIAKKYNQPLFVPHIVERHQSIFNTRKDLGIPENELVIGRIGGVDTFNIGFVQKAIKDILEYRKDIYFLLISTKPFIEHERVIFIPQVYSESSKFSYIEACDAMIHARADGETFGLAIGEFSVCNKPVITWSGNNYSQYDTCHLDLLGKKAIIYNNYQEVLDIFYSIKREDIISRNWDVYSKRFSEKNVIEQFNKVFLS